MALSGVDKFPLVAKILVDMRLQELVQENRKLREENQRLERTVFWKLHSLDWFKKLIKETLQTRVKCKCKACHWYDSSNGFNGEWDCSLQLAFKNLAEKHGFIVVHEGSGEYYPITDEDLGETEFDPSTFCTGDVHFVLTQSFTDWVVLGFGEKFSEAKSIHDPEVVKLKQFFETLERMRR